MSMLSVASCCAATINDPNVIWRHRNTWTLASTLSARPSSTQMQSLRKCPRTAFSCRILLVTSSSSRLLTATRSLLCLGPSYCAHLPQKHTQHLRYDFDIAMSGAWGIAYRWWASPAIGLSLMQSPRRRSFLGQRHCACSWSGPHTCPCRPAFCPCPSCGAMHTLPASSIRYA